MTLRVKVQFLDSHFKSVKETKDIKHDFKGERSVFRQLASLVRSLTAQQYGIL